jgi:hypothetical protein
MKLPPKLELDLNRAYRVADDGIVTERALADAFQYQVNDWYANHIEPLFKGAVEAFNMQAEGGHWTTHERCDADTHRAWLIGIEPIQRGVTKEELVRVLRNEVSMDHTSKSRQDFFTELADRIEREGIKP